MAELHAISIPFVADLSGFDSGIRRLQGELKKFDTTAQKPVKSMASMERATGRAREQLANLTTAVRNSSRPAAQQEKIVRDLNLAFQRYSAVLKSGKASTEQIARAQVAYTRRLGDTRRAMQTFNAEQRRLQASSRAASAGIAAVAGRMRLLGAAAAAAAAFATKQFIAGSVKLAADTEEIINQFNTVFGESADEVSQWAEDLGRSVGRSEVALKGFASQFQDTFVPLGFARDQAARLSTQMTQLALDLSSFKNIGVDESVRSITSALVGNHEAVRKFGIVITQARLEQELFSRGFRGNVDEASNLEKVMARLSLIMKDTADAQGDLRRTADSSTNTFRSFDEAMNDLGRTIGSLLLPSVVEAAKEFTDFARTVTDFLDRFKDNRTELEKQVERVNELRERYKGMTGELFKFVQGTTVLTEEYRKLRDMTDALADAEDGREMATRAATETAVEGVAKVIDSYRKLPDAIKFATQAAREFEDEHRKNLERASQRARQLIGDDKSRAGAATASVFTPLEEFEAQKKRIAELQNLGVNSISDDTAMRLLTKAQDEYTEAVLRSSDAFQILSGAATNFGSNFVQQIADGRPVLESLRDTAVSVFADIVQAINQAIIRALVFRAVSGILSSAGGSAGAAFSGGQFSQFSVPAAGASAFPSAKGNVFNTGRVMPFAKGGIVSSPTIFPMANGAGLMGEAGPEAVLPLKRGAGGRLGVEASGGSGVVINMDLRGSNGSQEIEAAVQRGIRQAAPMIVQASVVKTRENRLRNPKFFSG